MVELDKLATRASLQRETDLSEYHWRRIIDRRLVDVITIDGREFFNREQAKEACSKYLQDRLRRKQRTDLFGTNPAA